MRKLRIVLTILTLVIIALAVYLLYILNIIPHRKYTNEDFGIATYISMLDKDGDGVDDQTDILQNVRAYIATNPEYKSKYYAGGYPDDGYGVCTDVVAQGLLHAGYDLQQLVNEDIAAHPDMYEVEKADPNIDFRRVRNLLVYFKNHAISLTTDVMEIEQWQGGDIIVFKKHIGIVSDKRNKNGVPFIIHHANPYQKHYEEDILENREDIVGHFRIS
ncbi:MAG: DUF1287 domain-containing protein [Lachnospiraceae bacterium]|nr:DUF1287 domain-containing protein [Lachnospiraceae bacterium]